MIHNMNLRPVPFRMIAAGKKIYELRLNDEKRSQIAVGDKIVFTNTQDGTQLTVEVKNLHRFASFAELYQSLPLTQCGYEPEELADASPDDMNIYYPPEKQKKYGVLAIEIRTLA